MTFNIDRMIRFLRIALILVFWSWALIWFSIRADRKEKIDRNFADNLVVFLRGIPRTVEQWFIVASANREHQEVLLDPELDIGKLGKLQHCSSLNDHLYLLHYRYEGEHNGKVYLQNIKTGEVAKTWDIPLQEIFKDLQELKRELLAGFAKETIPLNVSPMVTNNIPAIQISTPIMGEDSSLFFNCCSLGYLYKLDKNSRLVWKSEETVHHSIEFDEEGNIWTCSVNWGHPLAKAYKFREDAVLCLDADGKKSHLYSLSEILTEKDLFEKLVSATPSYKQKYGQDPYHLNDVLPVKNDGEFWRKGDLFLSIRHKSAVIQYRPQNGSVVWYQQGPWLAQHDIDIVNESVISVFNNNVLLLPNKMSEAGSNIAYFNFIDGTTKFSGQGLFATAGEGRQTLTVDDYTLVEETRKGVYVLLDSTGALQCRFYIPYYADPSHAMNPTWGRLYLQSGSKFLLQ